MSHASTRRAGTGRRVAAGLAATALGFTLAGLAPATTGTATAAPAKTCASPDFRDVPPTASFYTAITWMRCEGITTGYADGTFRRGQQITRGETAQFLYRLSGDKHDAGTERDFTDVNPGGAGFEAISWMRAQGYTAGYANGSFGINSPITRGELAAFLHRMSGEDRYRAPSTSPFTDMGPATAFYRAATWLESTRLVSGYADGTFRPTQSVTRGEAARFMYAMESRSNGAPPAYQVPTPAPEPAPAPAPALTNPTRGSGGTYRDAQNVAYSNGTASSTYHLYAAHLNGTKPHGIIVYLHGDGAYEYDQPQWSTVPQYAEVARKHNMMLVVPRTPDRAGANTWWEGNTSHQYAADLFKELGKKYNLDLNQVYWTGYSGGADTVAEHMMAKHSTDWTGGAAVIVAGGGIYRQPSTPISENLKKNFPMHWLVGDKDTPAAGGVGNDGYDALKAVKLGHSRYTEWGMRTTLTIFPGLTHQTIQPKGVAKLDEILAAR